MFLLLVQSNVHRAIEQTGTSDSKMNGAVLLRDLFTYTNFCDVILCCKQRCIFAVL